jgi:uncharacterized protein YukE
MIATLQESFKGEISILQNKVKEDVRFENEKLIKIFERENQKLSQELTKKLRSETEKFSHLLRQVQDDTESELVAVKRNLQVMSSEFDAGSGQHANDTSHIVDELASTIVYNSEQVIEQVAELSKEMNTAKSNFAKHEEVFQKRKGERLEHVLHAAEKKKER